MNPWRGDPILDGMLNNVRDMEDYTPLTGAEIIPIFAAVGSKVVGKSTLNNLLSAGGPGGTASQIVTVAAANRTLTSADHNKILDCTSPTGCTVVVPAGLTSGAAGIAFTCGLSKGAGAGNVIVGGSGVAVNAPGNLLTMSNTYGMMTLTQWNDGTFRLFGGVT